MFKIDWLILDLPIETGTHQNSKSSLIINYLINRLDPAKIKNLYVPSIISPAQLHFLFATQILSALPI